MDAGAKIYSNRVDAVHQQAMKLAESCLFAEKKDKKKKDKDSEDESNEEQSEETSEKARRKKVLGVKCYWIVSFELFKMKLIL